MTPLLASVNREHAGATRAHWGTWTCGLLVQDHHDCMCPARGGAQKDWSSSSRLGVHEYGVPCLARHGQYLTRSGHHVQLCVHSVLLEQATDWHALLKVSACCQQGTGWAFSPTEGWPSCMRPRSECLSTLCLPEHLQTLMGHDACVAAWHTSEHRLGCLWDPHLHCTLPRWGAMARHVQQT